MTKYKITGIMSSYENVQVQLDNGPWVYLDPNVIIGTEIDGMLVKKISRTWLEKDIGLSEAIRKKDYFMKKQIEENMKKGEIVRVI